MHREPKYTNEQLHKILRELAESNNGIADRTLIDPSRAKYIAQRFGNWDDACKSAGVISKKMFLESKNPKDIAKGQRMVIEELREYQSKSYKRLRYKDVPNSTYARAVRYFGTWMLAMEAAGLTEKKHKRSARRTMPLKGSGESLCWFCERSGAPIDKRCSWDAELILPDGAESETKIVKCYKQPIEVTMVQKCPQFTPIPKNHDVEIKDTEKLVDIFIRRGQAEIEKLIKMASKFSICWSAEFGKKWIDDIKIQECIVCDTISFFNIDQEALINKILDKFMRG